MSLDHTSHSSFPLASLSFDLPTTSRVSAGPVVKKHQRKLANVHLNFDNLALRMLPVDRSQQTGPREVNGACFSLVNPTPVMNPQLVALSAKALGLLDLNPDYINEQDLVQYFSGNKKLSGSETAAHCYCGHQFGAFSGQLGDGATMYLGEVVNLRRQRWELQLKGAGPTPFSRIGDGRKVLRSSIREFLCSEAMHNLGIPTSRAATVITSDTLVTRDLLYDGKVKQEKATLTLRLAPSFLRFGSFEIFKSEDPITGRTGPSEGRVDILKQMLYYTISTFYPSVLEEDFDTTQEMYLLFYKQVCIRTAKMVALWQSVGFCHGVLNTDNMSILGFTLDFGPYGFLDRYDPNYICNSFDDVGRYAYREQPEVCYWNLKKLAESLRLVISFDEAFKVLNENFYQTFNKAYFSKMRLKLGLIQKILPEDEKLIESFLHTMENTFSDYTKTLRSLSIMALPNATNHTSTYNKLLDALLKSSAGLDVAKTVTRPYFQVEQLLSLKSVAEQNPHFITLSGGVNSPIKREFNKAVQYEFIQNSTEESLKARNKSHWITWLGLYKQRLKKECEGARDMLVVEKERMKVMNSNNPKYILRNYIAQNAIREAQKGNFLEVRNVLRRLEDPYDLTDPTSIRRPPQFGFNNVIYDDLPPWSSMEMKLS